MKPTIIARDHLNGLNSHVTACDIKSKIKSVEYLPSPEAILSLTVGRCSAREFSSALTIFHYTFVDGSVPQLKVWVPDMRPRQRRSRDSLFNSILIPVNETVV